MCACALVAAGTGVATLHAVGHGGHVEIGPAALAHLKNVKPKAKPRDERPRETPRTQAPHATSIAQAPFLRGNVHDPKTLLSTAKQLQALGLDLTIEEVELAKPIAARADTALAFWSPNVVPVHGPSGHVDGLEVHGIKPESLLRAAGVADGDQILGIDGYDFVDDTIDNVMLGRPPTSIVFEIARGNHHVVLSIRWQVP